MSLAAKAVASLTCVAAFVAANTVLSTANAFGTIRGLGQDAEHEKITRSAMRVFSINSRVLDQLAGISTSEYESGTFGAVGWPDWEAVRLKSPPAAHCDNGDYLSTVGNYGSTPVAAAASLTACRDMMYINMQEAIKRAGDLVAPDGTINRAEAALPRLGCDFSRVETAKCDVLLLIGRVFHAAQDFYSHSNWTDHEASGNGSDVEHPTGLGKFKIAPFINLAVYDPLTPPDQFLMTGCFEGKPETLFCNNTRTKHKYLSKDTGRIDNTSFVPGKASTPRGEIELGPDSNFQRAVMVAVADTRSKWRYFDASVRTLYHGERGEKIICVIASGRFEAC